MRNDGNHRSRIRNQHSDDALSKPGPLRFDLTRDTLLRTGWYQHLSLLLDSFRLSSTCRSFLSSWRWHKSLKSGVLTSPKRIRGNEEKKQSGERETWRKTLFDIATRSYAVMTLWLCSFWAEPNLVRARLLKLSCECVSQLLGRMG